jgi:hypothetical protein
LHDALASTFGRRNVFMDVSDIGVGTDFVDQVERAISTSDASLVVIGPDWLGATDSEGRRRLDDPDDHVRSEVRSVLASPNPVVPVLVGKASLPSEDELPDDIAMLARRQAVELSDETWSEDVEMLVRRLEGKETARESRRWLPLAIGVVVLGVAGVVVWRAQAGGESGETPLCEPVANSEPTVLNVGSEATVLDEFEGRSLRFTVTSAEVAAIGSEWLIVLEVEVHNATSEGGNQDGHYYGMADFEALRVDDFANEPVCFSPQKGDRDDVTPTERASGLVGFELTSDPTGAALDLELDRGAIIEITSRA